MSPYRSPPFTYCYELRQSRNRAITRSRVLLTHVGRQSLRVATVEFPSHLNVGLDLVIVPGNGESVMKEALLAQSPYVWVVLGVAVGFAISTIALYK